MTRGYPGRAGTTSAFVLAAHMMAASALGAQDSGFVAIRIGIVGPDLNVKAVPLHELRFAKDTAQIARVRTGFDGTVRATLPAGAYRLESIEPVKLGEVAYRWVAAVQVTRGQTTDIELSNANAIVDSGAAAPTAARGRGEFPIYGNVRDAVFRVVNGLAHGSGFLVDSSGLVATNAHVVAGASAVEVWPDSVTRVVAQILLRDDIADLAVLWINPDVMRGRSPLSLATPSGDAPLVELGERLFAIGYPLHQERTLTSGVASSIRDGAIISDVNINHGNSGGPLLNIDGVVVGVNTFGDFTSAGGPGISGSVVVTRLTPLIDSARTVTTAGVAPSPERLPVPPQRKFALQAIKGYTDSLKTKEYERFFGLDIGRFEVSIRTPTITMVERRLFEERIGKDRKKREKKSGVATEERYSETRDYRDWAEYVGDERTPVVAFSIDPKIGETGGSVFRRLMVTGAAGKATLRYTADLRGATFYRNGRAMVPYRGGHTPVKQYIDNQWVDLKDVADYGYYVLPLELFEPMPDGATPHVLLVFQDLKHPDDPSCGELRRDVIAGVWNDFAVLFSQEGQETQFMRADPNLPQPRLEGDVGTLCTPKADQPKPF
jgi:S1-C subfamily serine protease